MRTDWSGSRSGSTSQSDELAEAEAANSADIVGLKRRLRLLFVAVAGLASVSFVPSFI